MLTSITPISATAPPTSDNEVGISFSHNHAIRIARTGLIYRKLVTTGAGARVRA